MLIFRSIASAIILTAALSWCGARDAHAEGVVDHAPRVTVAVAPSLGGITTATAGGFGALGLLPLEVSWRATQSPWWVRGEAAIGITGGIDEGQGGAYELRAGVEHRPSACGRACFYYGVDLAFARNDLHDGSYDMQLTSVLAVPRGGLDVGGDRVRFRVGLELPVGFGRQRENGVDPPIHMTSTPLVYGFALTTGLAVGLD